MAFMGAMSGFKPKLDDEDEDSEKTPAPEGDDEMSEGDEDDDATLGEACYKACQAGDWDTYAEMIRRIAAKK